MTSNKVEDVQHHMYINETNRTFANTLIHEIDTKPKHSQQDKRILAQCDQCHIILFTSYNHNTQKCIKQHEQKSTNTKNETNPQSYQKHI